MALNWINQTEQELNRTYEYVSTLNRAGNELDFDLFLSRLFADYN
jgi:hypothetical protein